MTITISLALITGRTQTHKRFKITLFIRTKYNMLIFGVSPFIKLVVIFVLDFLTAVGCLLVVMQ